MTASGPEKRSLSMRVCKADGSVHREDQDLSRYPIKTLCTFCSVTGHDFSRAEKAQQDVWALALQKSVPATP